jgi:succinate-semialdehyde dehydrogenase / glutarate-semialdehyde dehydrogenase
MTVSPLLREQCYIDGRWVDADDGSTIDVTNPATGEKLGTIPRCGAAETRRAIEAATAAFPAWRARTAKDRSAVLRKWFDLVMANQEELARLLTLEQGKSLTERLYGDVIPGHMADKRIVVLRQPIGVTAAITPWNFPNAMITRKAGPALAAGCPMVLKPAAQTPYSALALAVLAEEAGIPKGILSVVTGSASAIGGEMTSNTAVRKLSFTGSTEIGRLLMRQSADTVKKLSLELGGNAPFIVFDDADVDAAVVGAMASKYRNSGQTCVCTNRLYVQAGVHDEFVGKLAAAAANLKVGSGLDSGTEQGPLIDANAVAKVEEHIADALAKGATLLAGGKRHALGGTFFEPTVIAGVTQDMLVASEETFGPLAPVIKFETEDQAIAMANDTEFGLAAYFYSTNLSRVWRVAEAIESGMVCINSGILSTEVAPFGGVKQSGLGREGSKYGIDDYVEMKYLSITI